MTKKIIIILLAIYINFISTSLAGDYSLSFNIWLKENGHTLRSGCDNKKTRNILCYDEFGNELWTNKENNLNNKIYESWTIPSNANPNDDTLIYYIYKYHHSHETGDGDTLQWQKYNIKPNKNYYKFDYNLNNSEKNKQNLLKTPILSYLKYEDQNITIDEFTPKERFGNFVNENTKLRSMSIGKSMVSYVLGHAICSGYIDSVDSKINDWPLVKNTLYENQKLIDLLNMSTGDQKYVSDSFLKGSSKYRDKNFEADTKDIHYYMTMNFADTKPSKKKYNYSILNTNLIFNYILFKTGNDFEKILSQTFNEKARIKNSVYFFRVPNSSRNLGDANSLFYATRLDFLRIAKSMMDDYQNNTCVGKYLKEIYNKRISKGNDKITDSDYNKTKSYGGHFHFDYFGIKNKEKVIFGMGGYGGQAILIDMDASKIIYIYSMIINFAPFFR